MNAPERITRSPEQILQAATLIRVKIGKWSPYVHDAAATKKAYGTTNTGRANKHLCKESDRVTRCIAAFTAVGTYHNSHSAAWLDDGARMVRNEDILTHMSELRKLINAAEAARQDLADHWQDEIEKDRVRFDRNATLSGEPSVFNPLDYPHDVASRFYVQVRPMPVPLGSHMAQEVFAEFADEVTEATNEIIANAEQKAAESLADPIKALVNKLTEFKGEKGQRWHDSLVENVADVAARFRRMNVTGNEHLAQIAKDLESMAQSAAFDSDVLKENQGARDAAKTKLDAIMAKMGGYMGASNG